MPQPEDPLDALLDRWSCTPAPSSRLCAEVWQRLATQKDGRTRVPGPWASLEIWLERPAFSVGFVAACALLGLLLAEVRIGQAQRERQTQLARSYLQLIDPLVNAAAAPERRS